MNEFITQFETNEGNKKYDFQSLGNFPKAQIGQFLKVANIDENNNPIAWEMETIDMDAILNMVKKVGGGKSDFQKLIMGGN